MLTVNEIYTGSDGNATLELYHILERLGAAGIVALNLFRAQKCSSRAKVYHGGIPGKGSYRDLAYDRKQWSMNVLCKVLKINAAVLGICWGWKIDQAQSYHKWVLYVELPKYGQVSFHTALRGEGPDYAGDWDGFHASEERILKYVNDILTGVEK